MDGKSLGEDIRSAIDRIDDQNDHAKLWGAVAKAIVDHITSRGQVSAGIPVETTGSAAAQAGKTIAPGKIQ